LASITKRGDKQYHVRVRVKGFGVRCKTLASREEAGKWAAKVESETLHGVFVPQDELDRTTLAQALDRYAREVTPTKKGACTEQRRIAQLKRHSLAARYIASIRSVDLARYRDERLHAGIGANTIRLELALLSHVFEVARKDWGMESLTNPVKSIRKVSLPAGRERRLVDDEEARLLGYCEDTKNLRLKCAIQLAIATGMRRGELVGLRWSNIDLQRKVAVLPDTKNGTTRRVPLSSKAVTALVAIPKRDDDRVIAVHPDWLTWQFQVACSALGIDGLRFHDLRHEAVSRLFERGLNMMEVASVSGHKSLSMLKRYTHLRAEDLAAKLGVTIPRQSRGPA
jgi:integrase